jgi:hypothetical protein
MGVNFNVDLGGGGIFIQVLKLKANLICQIGIIYNMAIWRTFSFIIAQFIVCGS